MTNREQEMANKDLWFSVQNGDAVYATSLIYYGIADIYTKDPDYNRTLLHVAKGAEMIDFLVKDGRLDVNARDNLGRTPLMRMALKGRKEEVEQLLKYKEVDVSARIGHLPEVGINSGIEDILQSGKMVFRPREISPEQMGIPTAWSLALSAGHLEVADLIRKEMNARYAERQLEKEILQEKIEKRKKQVKKSRQLRKEIEKREGNISGVVLADDIAKDKISGREKRTITPEIGAEIKRRKAFEK